MRRPPKSWQPYRYRILCLTLALSFILLATYTSVGKAIFIMILAGLGYWAGTYIDQK